MQVLYFGRAPHTKETLPNFREKCRVARHSRVFRGLTGSQRTPRFWGVTLGICTDLLRTRGGKIGPIRWVIPVRPKLGPGWAIKLLAQKKSGQIWPGPARPARFFGRAGLLKFWPEKTEPILAQPGFGPAHCWPSPSLARPARLPPLLRTSHDLTKKKKKKVTHQ